MNDIEKSLSNTGDRDSGLGLSFDRIPSDLLVLPRDLWSDKVPLNKDALALCLPLIVARQGDLFLIIDGCKRFKALTGQGRAALPCGIIKEELDPPRHGLLRIELNSGRLLHDREKLLFIRWLKTHLDQESYRRQLAKLRLLPNEQHEFEHLAGCSASLVDAAMEGIVDRAVAPELQHLAEEETATLLDLFKQLSFSRQMQRELAEWLHEIAFINKTPLPILLQSDSFCAILADKRLNNPQKAAKIHETAHAIRFPLYSKVKKAWLEHGRRVNPDPSKVAFQASPAFEKNSLEVRIKATDAQSIHTVVQKLASLDIEEWQKLIDPTAIPFPLEYRESGSKEKT
jgi:hypothetical protein